MRWEGSRAEFFFKQKIPRVFGSRVFRFFFFFSGSVCFCTYSCRICLLLHTITSEYECFCCLVMLGAVCLFFGVRLVGQSLSVCFVFDGFRSACFGEFLSL